MCLSDEVVPAFPRTAGGGEALPPSSCDDLSANLLEGKGVAKSQNQEHTQLVMHLIPENTEEITIHITQSQDKQMKAKTKKLSKGLSNGRMCEGNREHGR